MKKIVLFRFEKEKMHFLECDIDNNNLIIGKKDSMPLSFKIVGEKYNKILDELTQINAKYSPDIIVYQSAQKFMGKIADEDRFANEAILNLFCYKNNIKIIEMSPKNIREIASLKDKVYKELKITEEKSVIDKFNIAKSNIILDGLVHLSIIKNSI